MFRAAVCTVSRVPGPIRSYTDNANIGKIKIGYSNNSFLLLRLLQQTRVAGASNLLGAGFWMEFPPRFPPGASCFRHAFKILTRLIQ